MWQGEYIFNHDGPIGKYQILGLDPTSGEDIRLALVAFGPNTLKLGGRAFDDVILHTYFTPETLQRCVTTVKDAAEQAGRDPASVRVWSCFATVGDHLPEELRLKKTWPGWRPTFRAYGDLLVNTIGGIRLCWNASGLTRWCNRSAAGIDHKASAEQIEHIATLIPTNGWSRRRRDRRSSARPGCVRSSTTVRDAVIMHGATPDETGARPHRVRATV